jgi:hypothetical protein
MDYMDTWKTLTGMTLKEALRKMTDILPPDAYSSVPGGAGLTDINPAYLTQVATEAFGLCGVGWFFDYASENVIVRTETRKKRDSDDVRTVYVASITRLSLYFRYVDNNGQNVISYAVISNGSSENDNEGYALRGALTNAIGAAFSKLCWQLLVYQGKIDHKNIASVWNKRNKKEHEPDSTQPQTKEAVAEKSDPTPEPVLQEVAVAAVQDTQDKSVNDVKPTEVKEVLMPLDEALQVVIPKSAGVPMSGKTLEVALNNAMMGKEIIGYLSGTAPKRDKTFFDPNTDELRHLQLAAKTILDSQK